MKFSCLSENLAQGLSIVLKAVSSKGSLPILSHVLLKTDAGRLKLGATDLDTGIVTWVGGKVEEEGSVTVPAKLLWDLVSQLPPGKVVLESKKQLLTISTEPPRTRSKLHGLSADEFPPLPEEEGATLFKIDPLDLAAAVSQVAFAAASDESRPILTGVLLSGSEKGLTFVGVDGFRLAEKRVDVSAGKEFSVVVPARILSEVARVGAKSADPVSVALLPDENQVLFFLEGSKILSRLLEGQFPDYEKIIPASFGTRAQLARDDLLKAVRLAAVFARDSASVVKLSFAPNKPVVLSSNTQDVGEHKTEVEASVEGEGVEVAFNSKYLTDLLSNLDAEEVIFESAGALNPGVFKPAGDSSDYLHIIMPVRVAE
jgi:DNA polymerase-3 subunit beta